MKKLFSSFLLSTLFASGLAQANETTLLDVSRFQYESFKSSCGSCCLPKPFGVLVNGAAIGRATLDSNQSQHLEYIDTQFEALYGFKVSPLSGITVNIGGGMHGLIWDENPFFSTKDFPFVNVGISGYTGSIQGWFWQAGINGQFDVNSGEEDIFSQYARYSMMLWGRYSYCRDIGIHLGVLAWTGIRKTNAWPILGIDWTISKHWELHLIVPIDLAIYYNFDDCWSLSLAGRPFVSRHRVGADQPLSRGVYWYNNYGTELSLNYDKCELLWSVFAGYSFGGTVKFSNSEGEAVNYQEFGAAPYVGLNCTWAF